MLSNIITVLVIILFLCISIGCALVFSELELTSFNKTKTMETNHKEFKPFDKVIFKYKNKSYIWVCGFFSNYEDGDIYLIGNDVAFSLDEYDILPYEGNEHLVGTTNEPEEEVKLEEGEVIIVFDAYNRFFDGVSCVRKFTRVLNTVFETNAANWSFAIRFSDFNPNDMEETKKHILCVKNGKVVKYKG